MNKAEYREYFGNIKRYIKIKAILEDLKMDSDQGNFSRFVQSDQYDYLYSTDRLNVIYRQIQDIVNRVI